MTVFKKILILGLLNLFIIISSHLFLSTILLEQKANDLDETHIFNGLNRTLDTLEDRYQDLSKITADWAEWDDTYEYIQDNNVEYIDSNVNLESFALIDVDEVIYVQEDKKIKLGTHFDYDKNKVLPLSEDIEKEIFKDDLIRFDIYAANKGIVFLDNRQVLIATNPILPSLATAETTSKGLLIMVRELNVTRIDSLSKILNHSVEFYKSDSTNIPESVIQKIFTQKDYYVMYPQNNTYVGYHPITDIFENTNGIVKIGMEREIKNGMKENIQYFTFIVVLINIFVILFTNNIINKIYSNRSRSS